MKRTSWMGCAAVLAAGIGLLSEGRAGEPPGSVAGPSVVAQPAQVFEAPGGSHPTVHRGNDDGPSHIYIFGVSGLASCSADFKSLGKSLRDQGFENTCFCMAGPWLNLPAKIYTIREQDMRARFVLIGVGGGCHYVRRVANCVAPFRVPIDLVIYSGKDGIGHKEISSPTNVRRVVNLRARDGAAPDALHPELTGSVLTEAPTGPAATEEETRARVLQEVMSLLGKR